MASKKVHFWVKRQYVGIDIRFGQIRAAAAVKKRSDYPELYCNSSLLCSANTQTPHSQLPLSRAISSSRPHIKALPPALWRLRTRKEMPHSRLLQHHKSYIKLTFAASLCQNDQPTSQSAPTKAVLQACPNPKSQELSCRNSKAPNR